jgi:hypothetical protein
VPNFKRIRQYLQLVEPEGNDYTDAAEFTGDRPTINTVTLPEGAVTSLLKLFPGVPMWAIVHQNGVSLTIYSLDLGVNVLSVCGRPVQAAVWSASGDLSIIWPTTVTYMLINRFPDFGWFDC